MKGIDKDRIRNAIREIIVALGDDPDREGLIETPRRVADMYAEVFEGMTYTNDEIAEMFSKSFDNDAEDLVIVRDIDCFSYCEHHLALMYDMKVSVAYIPHGKVLGLSKIARISQMVCKRLQLQERICSDIADVITKATGSEDVAVFVTGKHSCMTARGIKSINSETTTHALRGEFKTNSQLRNEVFTMMYRAKTFFPKPLTLLHERHAGGHMGRCGFLHRSVDGAHTGS